jgi:hypothetical protein
MKKMKDYVTKKYGGKQFIPDPSGKHRIPDPQHQG